MGRKSDEQRLDEIVAILKIRCALLPYWQNTAAMMGM